MSLEARARKLARTRMDIYEDGQYIFTCDKSALKDVDLEAIDDVYAWQESLLPQELAGALERAYSFLDVRMRSRREVADKLRTAGYADDVIDVVLDRLEEQKFLDDSYFAQIWVEERGATRSRNQLKTELFQKGISREDIEEALSHFDAEEEVQRCATLLSQKMARKDASDRDVIAKATQAAARKGYSWDTIRSALALLKEELDEEPYYEE